MRARIALYAAPSRIMKKDHPDSYWEDFFTEIRKKTGIWRITMFPYSHEPGGFYNMYAPWTHENGQWDLTRFDPQWWKEIRRVLRICKRASVRPVWVLIPGKYGSFPFLSNCQGVHGLWDPEAAKYQLRYIRKLLAVSDRIIDKPLSVQLSNEVQHINHVQGAAIGKQHQRWARCAAQFVPFKRQTNDGTESDFPVGFCSDEHDVVFGRKMTVKQNGFGTVASLNRPYEKGALLSWYEFIHQCRTWKDWCLSSDGCTTGDAYQMPGHPYNDPTAAQAYFWALTCYRMSGKRIWVELLPKSWFRLCGSGFYEDPELLDIGAMATVKEAWRDAQTRP